MPATFTEVLPERKAGKRSAMEWAPNDSGDFALRERNTLRKLAREVRRETTPRDRCQRL